jgi:hypothetical protein
MAIVIVFTVIVGPLTLARPASQTDQNRPIGASVRQLAGKGVATQKGPRRA